MLDALGEAGQRWWQLQGEESLNVDRRLDPLRRPAAVLLAGDPARVWDAVGPVGLDRDGGSAAARTQALVGEIAKDLTVRPDGTVTGPALNAVLAALAAFEADRLSQQLATGSAVTSASVQMASERLGYVVGFTAESAAVTLSHAAEEHDAVSARERALTRGVVEVVDLLPLKSAGPVGAVAGALVKPAEQLVLRIVDGANPVDHAGRAAAHGDTVRAGSAQLAAQSAREAVRLRLGSDEAALTVVSFAAADQVRGGVAAVSAAGPAPRRAP